MVEVLMQINNLCKNIKKKQILKDITFEVAKGEIFGFLGPNGSGKTTTIRLITGLASITEGEVVINGFNVATEYENAARSVGAIIEYPNMYVYMSGYKNLQQFARMSDDITGQRIDEVVKLVDLEDAIHDKVKTYSLGMKQRLGIAQALLHKPDLLILDEPMNGLDPQGIRDLRLMLKDLSSNHGMTVLISSHLLGEMELLCDGVGIINKGEFVGTYTMEELIAREGSLEDNFLDIISTQNK